MDTFALRMIVEKMMSNLRFIAAMPFLFLAIIATGFVFLFGMPAILLGDERTKKVFTSILTFIVE